MALHEFSIIERYFKDIATAGDGVAVGAGDDCAVLSPRPGEQWCVSTDTLIEGVHFPVNCSPEVVAGRTLGANLSDLAAMGAEPFACVLAMTLPDVNEAWLQSFARHLAVLLKNSGLRLAGGNLSRGQLSLTMTVMGTVPDGMAILRSTAQPGDDVYVTGHPGDAGRGLQLLDHQGDCPGLVQRYEQPEARVSTGIALRSLATAMIDVSDGLVADLSHLCRASGTTARLSADLMPLSDELKASAGDDALHLALTAGDDYELCFTARPESADSIDALAARCAHPITRIGQIMPAVRGQDVPVTVIDSSGQVIEALSGYRHFEGDA